MSLIKTAYMNSIIPIDAPSYIEQPDGSLLIKGVPLLAVGRWTSMEGIEVDVSEDLLMTFAGNWSNNGCWLRHPGGSPRSATEKVGAVIGPHYDKDRAAVIGDITLHRTTDESENLAKLVRVPKELGGINSVSAELSLTYDQYGRIISSIEFTGLAFCDEGACLTCKLPNFAKQEDKGMVDEIKEKEDTEVKVDEEIPKGHPFAESKEGEIIELLLKGFDKLNMPEVRTAIEEIVDVKDKVKVAECRGRLSQMFETIGGAEIEDVIEPAGFSKLQKDMAAMSVKLAETTLRLDKMSKAGAGIKTDAPDKTEHMSMPLSGRGISMGAFRGDY